MKLYNYNNLINIINEELSNINLNPDIANNNNNNNIPNHNTNHVSQQQLKPIAYKMAMVRTLSNNIYNTGNFSQNNNKEEYKIIKDNTEKIIQFISNMVEEEYYNIYQPGDVKYTLSIYRGYSPNNKYFKGDISNVYKALQKKYPDNDKVVLQKYVQFVTFILSNIFQYYFYTIDPKKFIRGGSYNSKHDANVVNANGMISLGFNPNMHHKKTLSVDIIKIIRFDHVKGTSKDAAYYSESGLVRKVNADANVKQEIERNIMSFPKSIRKLINQNVNVNEMSKKVEEAEEINKKVLANMLQVNDISLTINPTMEEINDFVQANNIL